MTLHRLAQGSITSPHGFYADAIACGLKSSGGLDLGLLVSETPCVAAGLFTSSRVKAAPVVLSRRHLRRGQARGIVVNSGNANACTGEQGLRDARSMAEQAAQRLGVRPEEMIVASTGVIGVPLPLEKVAAGLNLILFSREGGHDLARAIMTTDTRPKEIALQGEIAGVPFIVAGVAKGSGMIHPNLATMLSFITTDALVERNFLKLALKGAVSRSFNMITVDGDTSPNDMVVVLANGTAGNPALTADSPYAPVFAAALEQVCLYLARSIARDGEGATRLIEVRVEGALTQREARLAARTVAGSNLVKAAVYGADPNWGRVIAALGRSGVRLQPERVDLFLGQLCLMRAGAPLSFDKEAARSLLRQEEVRFTVKLNSGGYGATAWGCDLTPQYVTINSAYTT